MDGFNFPTPPTPDAQFSLLVEFPGDQKELDPSTEDTVEAAVSKKVRESGITDQPVIVSQATARSTREVFGGGAAIEPPELTALNFAFEEDVLSVDQLSKARRIIVATLRDYGVPAREENVKVRAVAPIDLGSL